MTSGTDPLTRGLSLYLDLLRVAAALVVFLTHLAAAPLTGGRWAWFKELELGRDAVVVFFVLSGLIIARSAARPGATGAGFAFDRITRLWSVALPALVLCWGLDQWGAALAPEHYAAAHYRETGLGATLALGLGFANEWWLVGRYLGSNLPYWSLSHEAAYYALFACAVFLRGPVRLAALGGGALLVGPGILAYMPAWLLGVWVWRRLERGDLPEGRAAWLLALGPAALAAGAIGLGVGTTLLAATFHAGGLEGARILRFGLNAPWGLLLAMLVALHLLGVAGLLRGRAPEERPWLRWAAGGSFSVYVVHQPVMHVLRVAFDALGESVLRDGAVAAATLVLCLAFAALFERTVGAQRRALRGAMAAMPRPRRAGTRRGRPEGRPRAA